MNDTRWLPPIRCMHEWPLVLFTALAVSGAGVYASRAIAALGGIALPTYTYVSALAAGLLIAGIALSFLHLGHAPRAPLALRRVGRNVLSTEVALASLVTVLAVLTLVPSLPAPTLALVQFANGIASVGLLVTFGFVYFLRGRCPWRSALVLAPLVSGLASGMVILRTMPGSAAIQPLALACLALDTLLSTAAWRTRFDRPSLPAHPAVFYYQRRLLSLRLIFLDVLPIGLLIAGFGPSAAIAVGVGVLLDRFAFYGLAVVESTEAAVADVERMIRDRG